MKNVIIQPELEKFIYIISQNALFKIVVMQLMISYLFSHISHIFHDDHYTSCGLLGDCDHATLQKCGHQASSVVTSIHFRISITGSVH